MTDKLSNINYFLPITSRGITDFHTKFITNIVDDSDDRAIVKTIIAMADSLEIEVIAEGVETKEQLDLLSEKGCTHFQGFLFGRPLPIEEFEATLMKR